MEKQLQQRILNPRLSDVSLAESIEVSPTRPIPRYRPPPSLRPIKQLCLAAMVISFIAYRLGFSAQSFECLLDRSHQLTQYLNTLANENPLFYNIISIVSQEAIEVEIIVMVVLAVMRIQNLRVHLFMAVFYGVRALHLQIAKLPFPEGIVSYTPVFPSFSVPYGITRDFYYSGHTGLMLFSALLWRHLKYRRLEMVTYPLLVIVVLVLLVTRVHYIIDIIGGAVFALWINRFLLPRVEWFDYFFSCIYNGLRSVYNGIRAAVS